MTGAPRSYVFFPCAQWTASANNHRARSIIRLAGDLVQDDVAAAARCTAAHWRDTCTAIYGAVRSTRLYLYTTAWCTYTLMMYTTICSLYLLDIDAQISTTLYSNNTSLPVCKSTNRIRADSLCGGPIPIPSNTVVTWVTQYTDIIPGLHSKSSTIRRICVADLCISFPTFCTCTWVCTPMWLLPLIGVSVRRLRGCNCTFTVPGCDVQWIRSRRVCLYRRLHGLVEIHLLF